MRDRIRPPKELEPLLDKLKEEFHIFETKQKGVMFAAGIGYALHKEKVSGVEVESFGEGIRMQYFESDDGFLEAIAVDHAGELEVLASKNQPDRIELFERCMLLGLQEIKKHCFDNRPEDPITGLLNLIDNVQNAMNEEGLPGLDGVAERVDEFM